MASPCAGDYLCNAACARQLAGNGLAFKAERWVWADGAVCRARRPRTAVGAEACRSGRVYRPRAVLSLGGGWPDGHWAPGARCMNESPLQPAAGAGGTVFRLRPRSGGVRPPGKDKDLEEWHACEGGEAPRAAGAASQVSGPCVRQVAGAAQPTHAPTREAGRAACRLHVPLGRPPLPSQLPGCATSPGGQRPSPLPFCVAPTRSGGRSGSEIDNESVSAAGGAGTQGPPGAAAYGRGCAAAPVRGPPKEAAAPCRDAGSPMVTREGRP